MNERKTTENLMKIGELAEAAGVSVSTVKFYVKEGLIRAACKTGRNMAYYDPACVSTIGMIRMLQKERFYPLSVIKRLLESSPAQGMELELLDAIHKVDYKSSGNLTPPGEAAKSTRLSPAQMQALIDAGVVSLSADGRRRGFSKSDLGVMTLVRRRMDAGIPFSQSVESFSIYERALRQAAQADVDAMAAALMVPDFTAEAGAQRIRVSDETLDAFIALKRKEFNRAYGSRRLEDLDRFERRLHGALREIGAALSRHALSAEAMLCAAVEAGCETGLPPLDEAAGYFWSFARDGDIARCIADSVRSRAYFEALLPAGGGAVTAWCLKASWLSLAPSVLNCGAAARAAQTALAEGLPDSSLAAEIRKILEEIGGQS